MQRAAAAGAGFVRQVDHHLLTRQTSGKSPPVHAAGDTQALACRLGFCRLELQSSQGLLEILQRQVQLVWIELFGPAPEAVPLELLDDLAEPGNLLFRRCPHLGHFGGMPGPLGDKQGTQRVGISRQGIGGNSHGHHHGAGRVGFRPHTACESDRRTSAGSTRPGHPDGPDFGPVETFEQG
jgi:hypothetical protein